MASADALLHPVRLRIVKALLGDRALTTTELRAELEDIPVASLYRHIGRLLNEGVIQVVAERRISGAVERTYTLRSAAAQMHPDEIAAMSAERRRQITADARAILESPEFTAAPA